MLRTMKPSTSSGFALLEAMVALFVLGFAVLGLLHYQLRSSIEGELAGQRVVAIQLAQDLFERVRANPGGAGLMAAYAADPSGGSGRPVDCTLQACSTQALIAWDLDDWRRRVSRELPLGQARIFQSDQGDGQLGVLLSWRTNEETEDADVLAPLTVRTQAGGLPLGCPARRVCHLLFSAR